MVCAKSQSIVGLSTRIYVVLTMPETLVTLRVPKELKERMKRSKINWSEELRKTIKTRLEADTKSRAGAELEKLLVDIKPGFNSLTAIKEARSSE